MPDQKQAPKPGKGEQWTPQEAARLAERDAEALRRDPSEARAYMRRVNPFLAQLLDAEPEEL